MTAKNLSSTTLQKEDGYMGAGTGTVYVVALQEPLDTSSLVHDLYPDTTQRSNIWDAGGSPTTGLAKGELSLALDLSGLGTNAGGAVSDDDDGAIIAAAIGTSAGGTGTTVDDSTPSTTLNTVASAAGLAAGKMVLIETTQGHKAAMISAIDTLDVTVTPALPVAPANGADIFAGVTYTPSETRTTWILEHHKDNVGLAYKCVGCGLTPEITNIGAAEGKARLNLKLSIGDWENIVSTLDVADPPDTFINPGVVQSRGRFVLTDGSHTVTCIASTFTVAALLTEIRRADACQPNTVGEPEIMPSQDRMITTELWQAAGATADPIAQLRTWFDEDEMLQCLYQVGNLPGDCIAFYFPGVYLNSEPKEVEKNGLMAIKTELKVSVDRNSVVFDRPFYFARF